MIYSISARSVRCKITDILAELQSHISAADKPNLKQLTTALKAAHFQYGA